jgi:flagellar motor switch protein FliN/FliY
MADARLTGSELDRRNPNSGMVSGQGDSSVQSMEDHPAWPMISRLPMKLSVGIPLVRFRVREMLQLASGQTIESEWPTTEDVPLKVGEIQVSWSEFEVVEQHMAVRLTRLA